MARCRPNGSPSAAASTTVKGSAASSVGIGAWPDGAAPRASPSLAAPASGPGDTGAPPIVAERGPLARGGLLQQRYAEHDLPGFPGRRLAYTDEIVDLVAEERLVMRTAEGPFPMETTYAWKDDGEGRTRMTAPNAISSVAAEPRHDLLPRRLAMAVLTRMFVSADGPGVCPWPRERTPEVRSAELP